MFMNHTPGKALDGHVIKTLQVKKQEQCELRCFHESECVSYNMGPSQVNGFTCEVKKTPHFPEFAILANETTLGMRLRNQFIT